MNLEIWQEIGSIGILAISTFWDIRFKKIPLYLMAAGILPGLILLGLRLGQSTGSTFGGKLMETAGCFLPGLFLLLLSFLTERKVGMGDGLLLLIIGAMEGAGITGFVFCWGTVFAISFCGCFSHPEESRQEDGAAIRTVSFNGEVDIVCYVKIQQKRTDGTVRPFPGI